MGASMDEEAKAVQEAAKAVQALAKTAETYQKSVDLFGKFLGQIFGPPIIEASGLVADYIKGVRLRQGLRFQTDVARLMDERKIAKIRHLPLSTGLTLLDAATLEEDPDLAKMFANLLVSYIDGDNAGYAPKLFIETLRNLTPYDAEILTALHRAPENSIDETGWVNTSQLPKRYLSKPESIDDINPDIDADLAISLASLRQLGCIDVSMTMDAVPLYHRARISMYGRSFLEACGA
jgi:hypothetical protein